MAIEWYRAGTVSVENGSTAVTGTQTLWQTIGTLSAGDIFIGPDVKWYEVTSFDSDTGLTLKTPYQGVADSAQSYAIVPLRGNTLTATLAQRLSDLLEKWHNREDEFIAWLTGTGSVTLTDVQGNEKSVKTPEQMETEFNDLLATLGSAAQADVQISATDTTTARLMAVGAFGWGKAAPSLPNDDADALGTMSGAFQTGATWTGSPFAGTNGSNQGTLLHIAWDTAYATQIWQKMQSQVQKIRHKNNGVWSGWDEQYHTGNLVGAWQTPTLLNGWVAYDAGRAPKYRIIGGKLLQVTGLAKDGTAVTIFTLPSGYRPIEARYFSATLNDNSTSRGAVYPDGQVRANNYDATNTSIDLIIPLD